jgi:CheY-like chemotaxis protein
MTDALVLLVDDAPEMGLIVARLGSRCGCAVEHRPDAETALAFLQDRRPDLLLLDINLPGMSGPELCRHLRSDPRTAALAIALFTHPGLDDDIAAGLEAGADFFFSKDLVVAPEAWAERLLEVLGTERGQRSPGLLRFRLDEAPFTAPADWPSLVNGALRQPLRDFGPSVVRVLLRRALSQVFAPSDTDRWLTPDGSALDRERVPALSGRAVAELAAALVGQVGRLTGTKAASPFRTALDAAFPDLPESLTRR